MKLYTILKDKFATMLQHIVIEEISAFQKQLTIRFRFSNNVSLLVEQSLHTPDSTYLVSYDAKHWRKYYPGVNMRCWRHKLCCKNILKRGDRVSTVTLLKNIDMTIHDINARARRVAKFPIVFSNFSRMFFCNTATVNKSSPTTPHFSLEMYS